MSLITKLNYYTLSSVKEFDHLPLDVIANIRGVEYAYLDGCKFAILTHKSGIIEDDHCNEIVFNNITNIL